MFSSWPAAQGVELGDWFQSPVHPLMDSWDGVGYRRGACPVAEKACDEVVNIPTHDRIRERDIDRAVGLIADYALSG